MRRAALVFSRNRPRSTSGLVRRVLTKAYPTRRLELHLRAGLRCSFAQSIAAKSLFLASGSLQRVVARLTRRVGPERANSCWQADTTLASLMRGIIQFTR